MVNNIKKRIQKFFVCFLVCFAFILFFRYILGEKFDISKDLGYLATFSGLYAITASLWSYSRCYFILSIFFFLLHLFVAWLKIWSGMLLPEREITHTLCYAITLFSSIAILFYAANLITFNCLRRFAKTLVLLLYACCLLPVMIIIGYVAVNNSLFSTDIIMAIFQTNFEETIAYLQSQNILLWSIGTIIIILIIGTQLYCLTRLKIELRQIRSLFFAFCLLLYAGIAIFPKLNLNYIHNLAMTTYSELHGFTEFKQARKIKLQQLKSLNLTSPQKGIYVLVIGESLTKDHMSLYGYARQTTPWLDKFTKNSNVIAFQNAYANHTHTVPALSFALSEKNQYNNLELEKVASIIDVAEAAGYKTYWLSNQLKYSLCDTPINIIGASADTSKWINTNTGDKLSTSFYDEKLLDFIPQNDATDKALIVIHLMGNHNLYQDRYPIEFHKFSGSNDSIDTYDNSILYNDYVIKKIYERMVKNPNFKALVYFADHGDDVDNHLGHNSSLFTYRMARIPLIIGFSEQFSSQNSDIINNLRLNQNAYWTNDLIYNLLIGLMQIKGLENNDETLDLSSADYKLPKEDVLLLHGEKNLQDE